MASDRQLLANRRNALRSSGPRTQRGKAASARNALKHGLTGRDVLLAGEDVEAFDALRSAVFGRLEPKDALEGEIVEQIVGLLWRLRRIPRLERCLLEWISQDQAPAPDPPSEGSPSSGSGVALWREPVEIPSHHHLLTDRDHGRMLHAALDGDLLGKLSRYERDLSHRLREALHKLMVLQTQQVPPFPMRRDVVRAGRS